MKLQQVRKKRKTSRLSLSDAKQCITLVKQTVWFCCKSREMDHSNRGGNWGAHPMYGDVVCDNSGISSLWWFSLSNYELLSKQCWTISHPFGKNTGIPSSHHVCRQYILCGVVGSLFSMGPIILQHSLWVCHECKAQAAPQSSICSEHPCGANSIILCYKIASSVNSSPSPEGLGARGTDTDRLTLCYVQ